MPLCTKKHHKVVNKHMVQIPCYYIAGNCISDPLNQGGYESYLRATYPYYHAETYELSKTQRTTVVPSKPL